MDTLKNSEIKGWDNSVISSKITEIRKKTFEMKMQKAAAGFDKPHLFNVAKKNIARLKTELNARVGK